MDFVDLVTQTFERYQDTESLRLVAADQTDDRLSVRVMGDREYLVVMRVPRDEDDAEWTQYPATSMDDWVRYAVFYRVIELHDTGILASQSASTRSGEMSYTIPSAIDRAAKNTTT